MFPTPMFFTLYIENIVLQLFHFFNQFVKLSHTSQDFFKVDA